MKLATARSPPNSNAFPAFTGEFNNSNTCVICEDQILDNQECLIITQCSHYFHRLCLENVLTTSSECPICKRPCPPSELRKYNLSARQIQGPEFVMSKFNTNPSVATGAVPKKGGRGKPRGAKVHYHTRSHSQAQSHELPGTFLNLTQDSLVQTPNRNYNTNNNADGTPVPASAQSLPINPPNVFQNVDADFLGNMIEARLARLLTNLNIIPQASIPNEPNIFVPTSNPQVSPFIDNMNAIGISNTSNSSRLPLLCRCK